MGAVGAKLVGRHRPRVHLGIGCIVVLLALAMGPAMSRAAGCGDNWTGKGDGASWFDASNWDNGVPQSTTDACIPAGSSTVVILGAAEVPPTSAAAANTLTVGAGDTLTISGVESSGTQYPATLTLTNGGSIASGGAILMTASCVGGCTGGAPSTLNIMGGTLTNNGTFAANAGSETTPSERTIVGDLDNQGTLSVDTDVTVPGSGSVVTNDTGGSITNDGNATSLIMGPNTTFDQGAGTTPATPTDPAVIVDSGSGGSNTLNYTGSGASTIVVRGQANMSGDVASGQNLVVDGTSGDCNSETVVTPAADFSNAGTITLTGTGCSGIQFPGHTLTNTGTLDATSTGPKITREIKGGLTNSGTLNLNGDTAFDGAGATLTQTGGTTTIGVGRILDLTGSTGNFDLQGGLLQAPGSNSSKQGVINGALDNSGGNIAPGSTTAPGDMTVVGQYTQGAGGELTSVIDGTSAGNTYSQLAVTGGSTLGGTLDVVTHSGFVPAVNDLFTVLGGSNDSGKFATVTGLFHAGSTFGYRPLYDATDVTLEGGAALLVKRAGPGSGSVTSSPAGISCGTTCDAPFFQKTVTLTAHPGAGSGFQSWSGAPGCGQATTCKVSMTQARTVTATFGHATTTKLAASVNPVKAGKAVTYTATVTPKPNGGTVKFTDNGKAISGCGAVAVSPSTGKATCKTTYKSKGAHIIKALYSGNASFVHSTSGALTETVKS